MNVGKRTKSILSVLLICGLLVVSVPSRIDAAAPVALGAALKYAIAAGIVAGGLYASNTDALDYVINDYWNKASSYVKRQWQNVVVYGTGIGIILLNNPLKESLNRYLDSEYDPGNNTINIPGEVVPAELGSTYRTIAGWSFAYDRKYLYVVGPSGSIHLATYTDEESLLQEFYGWYFRPHTVTAYNTVVFGVGNDLTSRDGYDRFFEIPLDAFLSLTGQTLDSIYEFVGDIAGFGNATADRPDIKVPCPPVPAAEWPDKWIDDLLEELNRTGNPTIDDETMIEEWEDEYDWYLDEYGNIYKVKKGQPPRKPDDEPIRIPPPPLPAPNIPEDYPTEDDPEITIEHNPPQTTVEEHPDGSRTEVTTQTSTITKTWWDPTTERWRTTKEETTTTTTVDYAPDGTEIGRTTTTTTQPKGEREETPQKDDTAIDWEPLRRGLYELTEKFPFCLPWDLMRGIETLEASQWDRKIRINVGDGIWPEIVIDLTMFDGIARITRVVLLVVFDLGLIFATRRLMGGDV